MAYLKLIANPADDEAFRRAVAVPKRGLGDTTIEQLAEASRAARRADARRRARPDVVATLRPAARTALAEFVALIASLRERAREAAVDELLRELVDAIRYGDYLRAEGPESAERLENVRELITGAAETVADERAKSASRRSTISSSARCSSPSVDALGPDADAVTLMTLHNAKGLEFPVVFITGLEDGLFPLAQGVRRSAAARGGAPALLRRHHARRAEAVPHARRGAAAQRRVHAVAGRRAFSTPSRRRMLEKRSTIKVRSSGRSVMRRSAAAVSGGNSRGRDIGDARRSRVRRRRRLPAERRGAPAGHAGHRDSQLRRRRGRVAGRAGVRGRRAREASQVRQRHDRRAGGQRVATPRSKIDFDDETIGRKTLVIAQANLERGDRLVAVTHRRRSAHRRARAPRPDRRARATRSSAS